MLWSIVKKAKDGLGWFNFAATVLGWLGLWTILSGVAITAIGVVGSVIKGLPWPFVLMAAYCTLVGMAYLVALPVFIKGLRRAPRDADRWRCKERTCADSASL
jgi:hypothetical protein